MIPLHVSTHSQPHLKSTQGQEADSTTDNDSLYNILSRMKQCIGTHCNVNELLTVMRKLL